MKETTKGTIILVFLLFDSFFGGVAVTLAYQEWKNNREIPLSENENCKGLEFYEAMECLNQEVKEFYNYNISNRKLYWDNGEKNIQDWNVIKTEGGVCWHYAEYYVMKAEQLGFEGFYSKIMGKDINHAFAIISDEKKNYCVLDQRSIVGCHKLKEELE